MAEPGFQRSSPEGAEDGSSPAPAHETTRLQETMSFGQTEGAVPENLINPLDSSPSPPAPVPGGNTPSRAIRPPTSPSVQPDNLVSPF